MKDVEVVVENLTNAVFEEIANVEEGIESLAAMYNYTKRKTLFSLFDGKTLQVLNLIVMGLAGFNLYDLRCIKCSGRKFWTRKRTLKLKRTCTPPLCLTTQAGRKC